MKTLLICLDFSDSTKKIICDSVKLAKAFSEKLVLLHVAQPDPDFIGFTAGPKNVRNQWAQKFHSEHKQMVEIKKQLASTGLEVLAIVVQGMAAEKILEHSHKLHADMIIMGTHGHGKLHHLLIGSVSEKVLKKTTCPVLFIPNGSQSNAI